MNFNEDINELFANTERFLKQERELYGEIIFRSESAIETPSAGSTDAFNQNTGTVEKGVMPKARRSKQDEIFQAEGCPLPPYPDELWTDSKTIDELNNKINSCTKCSLGKTRIKFVFGVGNPKARVVVVGEAPGADEDEQGEPFVGRAGQLLNKILESINFKRNEVYICNILKCRPPNNRDPQTNEIDCCEPYLWKQLEIIKPKLILCVGRIAGQSLLKTNDSLALLRSKVHDYRGIPLMVTYHPAALLRNPNWKRPCWEDVQQFRKLYDEM